MNQRKNEISVAYIGRFNPDEILSGPEKTAKRIFAEHSKNHKSTFLQYYFDGRKYGLWKKLWGKETQQVDRNASIITTGLFRLYGILKELKPDIIHIITFERFAVAALLYAKMNSVKVIYNEHGVITHENLKLKNFKMSHRLKDKFCEKRFLTSADKLVFPSETALDTAESYFRVDETKAVILPNGIDEHFKLTGRKRISQGKLKAVFIYKNEFSRTGLELLSASLFELKTDLELYIISGEEMELKLGNNIKLNWVKFIPCQELAEFYWDKDIFLSLNSYDTFSISTAEAMASGLIPIITEQTGIERYICSGINGFVIDDGNPESLSTLIGGISEMSPEKRQSLSANAARIYELISWKEVYQMYLELYREVLA